MSWNDPCRGGCGQPNRDCECPPYEPKILSVKEEKERKQKKIKQEEICKKKGHDLQYSFIVYTCKRCGYTTEY